MLNKQVAALFSNQAYCEGTGAAQIWPISRDFPLVGDCSTPPTACHQAPCRVDWCSSVLALSLLSNHTTAEVSVISVLSLMFMYYIPRFR